MSDSREVEHRGVRASDRDRERVAAELQTHCVEGRITLEELDQRLEGAMAARTVLELAELVYDLPTIVVETPQTERASRVRVGPPGAWPFTHRVSVPTARGATRALVLEKIAPALNGYGYELTSQSRAELVFERTFRPGWTALVAVFLFPFGLLALGQRKTERIVFSLEREAAKRTAMTVHGTAPRQVRAAFARLTFP